MTDAAVGADLDQALDRLLALAPQVALGRVLAVDVALELRALLVREVFDLLVRGQLERSTDLARARGADPVDVRQPDLEPLLVRKVHSGDACHWVSSIPVSACVAGW